MLRWVCQDSWAKRRRYQIPATCPCYSDVTLTSYSSNQDQPKLPNLFPFHRMPCLQRCDSSPTILTKVGTF
ncbi:Uncharacterized protein TCM_003060 [Theobroma cacao]|uniref:Uncharacterized protein n=1 Tax=Theobroma cacao TaxID=3641 RepID=A0A061DNK5_THECC|nr:Uncharacterized protein TCM_003060 [Theobroma cacao]